MPPSILLIVLLLLSYAGYQIGKRRSLASVDGKIRELHSLPGFYGLYSALWSIIPALIVTVVWLSLETAWVSGNVISTLPEEMRELSNSRLYLVLNDIKNVVNGVTVATQTDPVILEAAQHYKHLQQLSHILLSVVAITFSLAGIWFSSQRIDKNHRARNAVEKAMDVLMMICSTIAIFTTIGIVFSVLFESIRFFKAVPITDFLFGLEWSPQTAMRSDQVGSSGAFGAIPLFTGTLLVSLIAMLVAVPIGLMSAIYLSEFASPRFRATAKPTLEILAGIPTVVYGFFAALTVAPIIRQTGEYLGFSVSSESALAAGLVMGVMIIPFVSSLSDDVMNAVPQSLRDGAYALGATQAETIRQVIFPAALPGIVGSILLAVSRAIGETMILVMAAGLAANLTFNPFEAVTTVTVQIVTLLVGDQEFDSPKTLAAFALGLVLFIATLILNVFALYIVRKYREQYE
ncbi:phosphate ABC transporter permease subunit PstC [Methylomarinum vadi]|uniref:phosphate ABC transporter permease subunit PstC n=1 Tax=Methylomarinum vadi TaxID=438855 RepID=UPI0004DF1BE0|nr:phosphate ABC transporter permease subunit PstC [Methylomarinum vadi]